MKIFGKPIILTLIILVTACDVSLEEQKKKLEQYTSLIKITETPDQRVELFDVNFVIEDGKLIAEGVTTTRIPLAKVNNYLTNNYIDCVNKIRILPDTAVGVRQFAVARNSVINIRSKPKHSSELGTQGLLGMSLRVLDKKGDFYRVQTPDKYISWVDKGGITRMTKKEFDSWDTSKKIIYTQNFGYVFSKKSDKSDVVSDITLGGLLQYIEEDKIFYKVKYPDNRIGFIKKSEAYLYDDWLQNLNSSQENIETIAKKMEGFPYLWGGTSSKGMDCSGFTKMVYLMNGFIIPRDASQQVNVGQIVDPDLKFEGLKKGDLLFFGKKATTDKKERVTHVAIWLGNGKGEFIHASGNVHINSVDDYQPNFDAFNKNRYLGSRRYLGIKDDAIVQLVSQK